MIVEMDVSRRSRLEGCSMIWTACCCAVSDEKGLVRSRGGLIVSSDLMLILMLSGLPSPRLMHRKWEVVDAQDRESAWLQASELSIWSVIGHGLRLYPLSRSSGS